MAAQPGVVFVFSGKRKCGKDYVAERLRERIGADCSAIYRLSAPLKEQYARDHDLDFARLLDASAYKERYRGDMIRWGEEQRERDPDFFCELTAAGARDAGAPVWIVSDARRRTDVAFFRRRFARQTVLVRVVACEATRRARGWTFTEGVDDAESECGLDEGVAWDHVVENDGNETTLERHLDRLHSDAQSSLEGASL
ncbi:PREDICTED: phosphomevalonate kinase-like [Priapulus caudatus]|uniref:Phosphomevalonate kinase n=1 Tax=Priapulus caudatus TaxID=37621 RepID=A0ABM1EDB7_PRICU|nr:PREDICTED: phosphomevalonate kinase-like [Priapulus caudatus]